MASPVRHHNGAWASRVRAPRATLGHRHGIAHNLLSAGRASSLRRMLEACRDTVVGQYGREHRSLVPGRSTLRDARGITTPNAARLHNRQNPAQYTTGYHPARATYATKGREYTCDCRSRRARWAHRATTAAGRLPWATGRVRL
jgi:hypothetical protein